MRDQLTSSISPLSKRFLRFFCQVFSTTVVILDQGLAQIPMRESFKTRTYIRQKIELCALGFIRLEKPSFISPIPLRWLIQSERFMRCWVKGRDGVMEVILLLKQQSIWLAVKWKETVKNLSSKHNSSTWHLWISSPTFLQPFFCLLFTLLWLRHQMVVMGLSLTIGEVFFRSLRVVWSICWSIILDTLLISSMWCS